MTGIYLISCLTTGDIYIGMTTNYFKREKYYAKNHCKNQPKLFLSIEQYGWQDHMLQMILEFPSYTSKNILMRVEEAFIKKYKKLGHTILNSKIGRPCKH